MGTDAPASGTRGRWAYGLILAQSTLYGLGGPITKIMYSQVSVYPVMVMRYLIALAILMALFGRRTAAGLRTARVRDWLVPSLFVGLGYIMGNLSVQHTAATNTAFLRSLSSVLTPLLALAVFRRRYSWRHLPILALVLAGMYLLCGPAGLSRFGRGEVYALTQAFLMAGSLVFAQRSLERVDSVTLTVMMTASSLVLSLLGMLASGGGWDLTHASGGVWAGILYLSAGCTIGGYFLQNTALRYIPSRVAALLQCMDPVMTAVFSRMILGERLTAAATAGGALILLGVAAEITIKDV